MQECQPLVLGAPSLPLAHALLSQRIAPLVTVICVTACVTVFCELQIYDSTIAQMRQTTCKLTSGNMATSAQLTSACEHASTDIDKSTQNETRAHDTTPVHMALLAFVMPSHTVYIQMLSTV